MRRFELVDGVSKKFWEIRTHGVEFTVSFGRIGTQGQCKTKPLASAAAAEAEVAKLIREKTAKGYVEVALGASPSNPPVETLQPLPEPRRADASTRGTGLETASAVRPAATPALAASSHGQFDGAATEHSARTVSASMGEPQGGMESSGSRAVDDGLVWPSAGFLWTEERLAELPPMRGLQPLSVGDTDPAQKDLDPAALKAWPFDVDPRQCTDLTLWSQACSQTDLLGRAHRTLVQAATALHGLPFALELTLSCAAQWLASNPSLYTYAGDRPARRLRKQLAVCSEPVHAACVEIAARFRGVALETDALISFMLPEQAAWANECAQHPGLDEEVEASWLDDTALSPANALRVLRGRYGSAFGWQLYFDTPRPAQTALLQLRLHGVGALSLFDAAIIKEYARWPRLRPALERLLGMLECVEAPETFAVLFRHVEHEAVRDSLQRLATRWPVALFKSALLTPRRSEALEDWAVSLAASTPEIVDVALEASTPAERTRMDSVVRARLRPIEAPLDALPAALRETTADLPAAKGKKMPLPEFFDPRTLHRPLLRCGGALPRVAMIQLGRLLAASTLQAPRPELDAVRAACTPESLSECAWNLFRAWQLAGSPSKQGWAFAALGLLGNDAVAHRLAPLIREWPGQSAHARATLGLDILAALGSDAALMQLNGIAEKVKHAGLQARARERIEHIAAARGLTPIELADRLVPDLGLDTRGCVSLNFGSRQFQVTLDDALKPRLRDATGRLLKDLPKPGRGDDAELAEAAVLQFKALKKDAKAVAALHVPRLERAMCEQRRWRPAVFESVFVAHPLMGLLARRLLWGVYRAGRLVGALRIAEDHSLADSEDCVYRLAEGVEVGIVHPLELPSELAAAFGGRFSDYEIVQPFRQLGRETYTVDPAERQAGELLRFKDRKTSAGALMSLAARGWESETSSYAIRHFSRPLPGGQQVSVELEPGIQLGDIQSEPEQWLLKVDLPAADADPVQVSELIRDLELAAPI